MCEGPLKCGGPCSAEHVRTLVNPALSKTAGKYLQESKIRKIQK